MSKSSYLRGRLRRFFRAYLCIFLSIFGCPGSRCGTWPFSSCEWGSAPSRGAGVSLRCLSSRGAQAVGCTGFRGSRRGSAQGLGLAGPRALTPQLWCLGLVVLCAWNLLGPGIKPEPLRCKLDAIPCTTGSPKSYFYKWLLSCWIKGFKK